MFAQNMMTKPWNQPRWPDARAPVGPALSCRLIGIRREWPAYGNLGTDVLIALASLRSELSPGIDYRTCQRLSDWAKTVCDLYTIDLSSTFTCKAEAVGKRIHPDRGGGTDEGGAAVFLLRWLQSLICCGICAIGEYSDHMPSCLLTGIPLTISGGSEQWPGPNGCAILPPLMSPIEGPGNIGQMHWASGKDAVPVAVLTSIVPPVGVQIEAAQRAKAPGPARKPATVP